MRAWPGLFLMGVCLAGVLASARSARADAVVGAGTAESCTEAALDAALLAGGTITFACGPGALTITLTTPKSITASAALDGGDKIILSGGGAIRPFTVSPGGSLTLQSMTIANGMSASDGGCLLNAGTLTLVDAIVQHCHAGVNGGGICNAPGGTLGLQTVTVRDAHAGANGGGIYNPASLTMDDIYITGSSAIRGGGLHNAAGTAMLSGTYIDGNTATLHGGGTYNAVGATLQYVGGTLGSEIADNMAASPGTTTTGGGLRNDGTASLTDVWIRNNVAVNGGGIANVSGTLTATGVTLNLNEAQGGSGGGLDNSASATFTNSTFSDNDGTSGGGLMQRGGTVSLVHTTMSGNTATTGGSINRAGGTVTLRGSILAATSGGNCAGEVSSDGYNVPNDATCALAATGDQSPKNPELAALSFNSGQTPTCLPMTGSPVIDTATGPGCPATDQRGEPRPVGPACDIGSVEVQTTTTTSTSSTSTSSTTSTSSSTTSSTSSTTSTSFSTTTSSSSTTSTSLPGTTTSTSSSSSSSSTIQSTTSSSSSSTTSTSHPDASTSSTSTSSSTSTTTSSSSTSSTLADVTTSTTEPGVTSTSTTTMTSSTSSTLADVTTSTTEPGVTTSSTSSTTTTSSNTSSTLIATTTSTTEPAPTTTSTSETSTSSVTVTTVPPTTTTLPDPCATVPLGATFESVACRLDALDAEMVALVGITPRAPKLRDQVGQATDLADGAGASCMTGDLRAARKLLKGSVRKLGRLRKLLASKASRVIPGRDALLATVKDLRTDVRALRKTLACPTAAAFGG